MLGKILLYSALLSVVATTTADQVAVEPVDGGTFKSPSARVRPRFRYWLPDPSVGKDVVSKNIQDAGDLGMGGVEFLPFYGYGGTLDNYIPEANWSMNGFGTPAFLEMFRTALETHKDCGLVMDFALGPNQGQGVPADSNDDGLQWDLVPYSSPVPRTGSFIGILPGWCEGKLVALVSAQVLSETNVTIPGPFLVPPKSTTYTRLTLGKDSLKDLTHDVPTSGHVSFHFGSSINGIRHQLFAFYEKRTLAKNLAFPYNYTRTIWDNGSYAVDHFSATGARTVESFWERHILKDGIKEVLADIGNYAWEDSLEIGSTISWTPTIPVKFQEKFGYSIRPFLPLIMWGNNNINIQKAEPGSVQCALDTSDSGQGYINDYRAVLEDGYREYLQELRRWVHDVLGLQTSSQVSYNMPMDAAASIPFSDAPECESLQWASNIDGYRQYTGAAHLSDKRVVSNELGAVQGAAYQYKIPDLIWTFNRAVAGGVNQVVIHGQSYTGNYYNTTWPGYTPFSYVFSDIFTDKQPSWKHGLSESMEYMARVQFMQQRGIQKTDIAIYNKASASDPEFHTLYPVEDLIKEGWAYEYLTADNLHLPQARVEGNVLAPDGPRYKAIVLPESSNLTLEATHDLKRFAEAGLPILVSGKTPGYYNSGNNSGEAAVRSAIADLLKNENVYTSESNQISQLLSLTSLHPQIRTEVNGTLYTIWREDDTRGTDHAFIFCDTLTCRGSIHVASTKKPYFLNPWSGERTAVLAYSVTDEKTLLPINLNGNETLIIGFADNGMEGAINSAFHATEVPSNLVDYSYESENRVNIQLSRPKSGPQRFTLSTGQSRTFDKITAQLSSFELRNWTLVAEHWEAPTDLYNAAIVANKRNTSHSVPSLTSWTNIAGLENASGVGYYSTSFQWHPSNGADGAHIRFSHVIHAVTAYVNDRRLPPLDPNAAEADIGPYLVPGRNHVSVVVPTMMWNYLRSIFSEIVHVGGVPKLEMLARWRGGELPPAVDVGLVGTVSIIPYVSYPEEA